MAMEARRGCGYRKVGGLYLCSDPETFRGCCKMPIVLHVCPTCNGGIKQSRAFQWIDPRPWLKGECLNRDFTCSAARPEQFGERVGLLWIGEKFYPTPEHFALEVKTMGLSKRVKAVPRGIELGETWVFLAHPRVKFDPVAEKWVGGVFQIVRPTRLEKILTETQSKDPAVMDDLNARGIKAFVVPDDDMDHKGKVYD